MIEFLLNPELVKLHCVFEIKVLILFILINIKLKINKIDARASQAFNFSFFVIDETKSIDLKPAGTFL